MLPGFSFTFLTHWNTIGKVGREIEAFVFFPVLAQTVTKHASDSFPQSFGKALSSGSEIPVVCVTALNSSWPCNPQPPAIIRV